MKKSKFTEEHIAFVLGQAESGTVFASVCRKIGISEATLYKWQKIRRPERCRGTPAV
jgi:putative transposase